MGVTANQKESCIYDSKIHFKDWKKILRLEFAKDIIEEWDAQLILGNSQDIINFLGRDQRVACVTLISVHPFPHVWL